MATKKIAKKPKPLKAKPGPKPDIYKIEGKWANAVKKSFQKKKSATGWPKA